MPKKFTKEDFIIKSRIIHGWKYDYSKVEYININTKICIICPKHGEFWQRPADHLQGRGCWKCSGCAKLTTEEFIEKSKLKHENKYDYSKVEYNGNKNKVIIICPKHGEFKQRPNDHLTGNGCPLCYGKTRSNTKEFIEKANKTHLKKYDYSKVIYIDAFTKVCITCPKHGDFWQTPSNHIGNKCRCPQCNSEIKSNGEKELGEILKSKNIIFIKDKKFDWLKCKRALRLDFYLPEYNIAIEVQGQQHYKPIKFFGGEKEFEIVKNRDKIKYDLCVEHGVDLLYINDKLKNIDELLLEIEKKEEIWGKNFDFSPFFVYFIEIKANLWLLVVHKKKIQRKKISRLVLNVPKKQLTLKMWLLGMIKNLQRKKFRRKALSLTLKCFTIQ